MRLRDKASKNETISHHYAANAVMHAYTGRTGDIPGYWIHGWLPAYFNSEPRLVALHKAADDESGQADRIRFEREQVRQWVSRADQKEALEQAGYARVEAIGLPFCYLPDVSVERRPGSLLVMPPHGLKKFFDPDLAQRYADAIAALKGHFPEIYACVTMRDYYRGEWRPQFERAGVPVFYGASPSESETLLRMKEILSTFEFVTSNAFGSQLAYAAHCGARVSVYGPYVEWSTERSTTATRLFPETAGTLSTMLSGAKLEQEYPFLFTHPADAVEMRDWGDREIGCDRKRSPKEIAELFDWD